MTRSVRLALSIMTALSASAAAQRPPRPHRSGLWGEVGVGPGSVRVACSGCTDVVTANGATGHLRFGGTISDHVLMGFEAFGFATPDSRTKGKTATAAVIIMWFPGKRGLFLKGGVGAAVGQFSLPSSATAADTSTGGGIGLTLGMGWDWPISRKFAITVNLAAYVTAVGDIVLTGRRVDDVIATMYHGSIGFTFR